MMSIPPERSIHRTIPITTTALFLRSIPRPARMEVFILSPFNPTEKPFWAEVFLHSTAWGEIESPA